MELNNNTITVREVLANPAAKALFKKEFPEVMNPLMLSIAKNMTLADVMKYARGRYPEEKLARVLEELRKL